MLVWCMYIMSSSCRSVTGKASTLPTNTRSLLHHLPVPAEATGPHILADPRLIWTPTTLLLLGDMVLSMSVLVGQGKWIMKIGENFGENHHHLCPQWVIGGVLLAPFILPMNGVSTGDVFHLPGGGRSNIAAIGGALRIAATVSHLRLIILPALDWIPVQKGSSLEKGDTSAHPSHTREKDRRRKRER